jgi:hypothetical protein
LLLWNHDMFRVKVPTKGFFRSLDDEKLKHNEEEDGDPRSTNPTIEREKPV